MKEYPMKHMFLLLILIVTFPFFNYGMGRLSKILAQQNRMLQDLGYDPNQTDLDHNYRITKSDLELKLAAARHNGIFPPISTLRPQLSGEFQDISNSNRREILRLKSMLHRNIQDLSNDRLYVQITPQIPGNTAFEHRQDIARHNVIKKFITRYEFNPDGTLYDYLNETYEVAAPKDSYFWRNTYCVGAIALTLFCIYKKATSQSPKQSQNTKA